MTLKVNTLIATATKLRPLLESGRVTSEQLVEACLHQISTNNLEGLKLRAVICVAPHDDLVRRAKALDAELKAGKSRSPLHGIPILIKDNIATHPDLGLNTAAGTYALCSSIPARNADIVDKLLDAGMIILGKTNLTELCSQKGPCVSGWSALGGQTISAYIEGGIEKDELPQGNSAPQGSSTGSAVAVSAGFCFLAIGTETDGSIISPAARAALYSLKPSRGYVDMDGVMRISRTFDIIGGMAKSPEDLAALAEITLNETAKSRLPPGGYSSVFSSKAQELRVGFLDEDIWRLVEGVCRREPAVMSQTFSEYREAIQATRDSGAKVVYPVNLPDCSQVWLDLERTVDHEFRPVFEEYLRTLQYSEVRSLPDLITWNKTHAAKALPPGGDSQSILEGHVEPSERDEIISELLQDVQNRFGRDGLGKALIDNDLDAIGILADSHISSVTAAIGYPCCTIPLGYLKKNGRPFGLVFFALPDHESSLFKVMKGLEAILPARQPPPALVKSVISSLI